MIKADLHLHSDNSDGSDSVEELAKIICDKGLNIVSLTDHDTLSGCLSLHRFLNNDIKYIKGVELTCKTGDLSVHILGYNCDIENKSLLALIEKGRILRRQKLERRVEYLKNFWNIELTKKELDWLYSRQSPVKTHFANILVNRGLAKDNISAMEKYLDGCNTGNTKFAIAEGIDAILGSGGIPVWAHPLGGEGERHFNENEFLPILKIMINYGIKGLECYYSRYNSEESAFLVKHAKANQLYISGGSDYHGNNKNIPIGRLNSENKEISSDLLTILEVL